MTLQGPTWPVTITSTTAIGEIALRPLRLRDSRVWHEVRARNRSYLEPWDATLPPEAKELGERPPSFHQMVRRMNKDAREGRTLPWVLTVNKAFAGQVTVGGITYGSLRAAHIGYWIDEQHSGQGVMSMAVAMATDYCLDVLHLHRVELNIRPENEASLAVARKVGFTKEGERPAYLHINGDWRDHVTFVYLAGPTTGRARAHLAAEALEKNESPQDFR